MRVAYVCLDPGVPVFGRKGCSIHVQEVVRALRARGHEVVLFAARADSSPPPDLGDLPVQRLTLPAVSDPADRERAALALNARIADELARWGPFDLVYERYSLWSFAAIEFAAARGIPGLLEVNAPLIEEQARHRALVDRAAAERVAAGVFGAASALLAVSEGVAGWLRGYPGASERCHVVPNAVDAARFAPPLAPSLPTPPGVTTVGFVGTLKPWHGLPVLVEAFARLHAARPATRLLIVGDGGERVTLERDLFARGLRDVVTLTGAVPAERIPGLLASIDIATAPYPDLPGFYFSPLKLFEYMAAGLPVVASAIGQIPEVIEDGVTGVLCPPGDALALTAALLRLHDDAALRRAIGRRARARALRAHTWDAVVDRVLTIASAPRPLVGGGAAR